MAATLEDLTVAVAAPLATIGLQTYVEPAQSVVAPAVQVLMGELNYETVMDGESDDVPLVVDLFVTAGPTGMATLYAYLARTGDRSIKALYEADPTLDGLVEDIALKSVDPPDLADVGGSVYYHAKLHLLAMVALA